MGMMFGEIGSKACGPPDSDSEFVSTDFGRGSIHYTEYFLDRVTEELCSLLEDFKSMSFVRYWVANVLRGHMHRLIDTAQRIVRERIEDDACDQAETCDQERVT